MKTRSAYRSLAAWTGGPLDLFDKEHVKTFWTGTVDESFVEESEQESPEFDEISEEIFKSGLNICENTSQEGMICFLIIMSFKLPFAKWNPKEDLHSKVKGGAV